MENNTSYRSKMQSHLPSSPIRKNCLFAFLIGGGICFLGEWMRYGFAALGASEEDSFTLVTISLIFLAALLTGIGVFDRIARIGGAGTLVPVTGFANAVVSPAIDTKSEGIVIGVGAKIFTVAGPVILFGILCGAIFGVIHYLTLLF